MITIWPLSPIVSVLTYSDARDYGCKLNGYVAKGNFSPHEYSNSSTWRELKGTANVLYSIGEKLRNRVVKHRSDNQNVTKILTVGSSKQVLHRLATDIFEFSIKNNIQLVPEWIPRIDNQMADLMSKQLDLDDYMLDPNVFATANIRWGPHTVDRFSSIRTRQYVDFVVVGLILLWKYWGHFLPVGTTKTIGCFHHHVSYQEYRDIYKLAKLMAL